MFIKNYFVFQSCKAEFHKNNQRPAWGKKKSIFLAKNFEELFLSIFIVHGEGVF